MKKAVGYIRVSTDDQAKEGISIVNQIEKIHRYAEDNNLQIIEICEDQGLSGEKIKNRPGMVKLFELANNNTINAVVAYKLDRLFRNASDALNTLNWFKRKKMHFTR